MQKRPMVMTGYSRCPFDESHVIVNAKLAKHIQKCRSPVRRDYRQCRYNPMHWTLLINHQGHQNRCEDRVKVHYEKSYLDLSSTISLFSQSQTQQNIPDPNWRRYRPIPLTLWQPMPKTFTEIFYQDMERIRFKEENPQLQPSFIKFRGQWLWKHGGYPQDY